MATPSLTQTEPTRRAPAHYQPPAAVERFKRMRRANEFRQRLALVGEVFSEPTGYFPDPINQDEVERLLKMGDRKFYYTDEELIDFSLNRGIPAGWLLLGDMRDLLIHGRIGALAPRGHTNALWERAREPGGNRISWALREWRNQADLLPASSDERSTAIAERQAEHVRWAVETVPCNTEELRTQIELLVAASRGGQDYDAEHVDTVLCYALDVLGAKLAPAEEATTEDPAGADTEATQ